VVLSRQIMMHGCLLHIVPWFDAVVCFSHTTIDGHNAGMFASSRQLVSPFFFHFKEKDTNEVRPFGSYLLFIFVLMMLGRALRATMTKQKNWSHIERWKRKGKE